MSEDVRKNLILSRFDHLSNFVLISSYFQFVASAKSEPQQFNFTLSDNIATNDPYTLLSETDKLQGQVDK